MYYHFEGTFFEKGRFSDFFSDFFDFLWTANA